VNRPLAEAMNETCAAVPAEVNEFELAGLEPAASLKVRPPRVQRAPVAFECQMTQIVQLQTSTQQPVQTWLVLGEVVGVHIQKELIATGIYDTAGASPVVRGGGPADYFTIGCEQLFKMYRPQ
jgi:flavin reductase (DIM6/NTAB) family NADH-FMN oxidoreductase RutF